MRIRKLIVLSLIFPVFIQGCARSYNYTGPEGENIAKVRFATLEPNVTVVSGFADNKCNDKDIWMRLRGGDSALDFTNPTHKLDIPLFNYANTGAYEVKIPANKEQFIMLTKVSKIGSYARKCGVYIHQIFEKNKSYEVLYENCSATLFEIVTDSDSTKGNVKAKKVKLANYPKNSSITKECQSYFKKSGFYEFD
jgi:hypothetical protein